MKNWKLLLRFVLTIGLVPFVLACATLTGAPAATPLPPTATPGPTSTITLTPTVVPTVTATPLPAWIADFAEPVLQSIANRAPKFQDDFSSLAGGWYNGATSGHPDVQIDGEKRVIDGEYRVIAAAASGKFPTVCTGEEDENVGRYSDFVAEFDVRYVAGDSGGWQIQFHRNNAGLYSFSVKSDNQIFFNKCDQWTGPDCRDVGSSFGNMIKNNQAWNHYLLIVRGSKMAAYINGLPAIYLVDPTYSDDFRRGYFSLNVCHSGSIPMETRWDNIRVWDISDLQ
jgi:hypothetical protein